MAPQTGDHVGWEAYLRIEVWVSGGQGPYGE